jgi:hypothetical protein
VCVCGWVLSLARSLCGRSAPPQLCVCSLAHLLHLYAIFCVCMYSRRRIWPACPSLLPGPSLLPSLPPRARVHGRLAGVWRHLLRFLQRLCSAERLLGPQHTARERLRRYLSSAQMRQYLYFCTSACVSMCTFVLVHCAFPCPCGASAQRSRRTRDLPDPARATG